MFAATRRYLTPGFHDRGAFICRDLRQPHRMRPPSFDTGLSTRRTHILHPLRTISEHRDEIAVALITGADENGIVEMARSSVFHLQRQQELWSQSEP